MPHGGWTCVAVTDLGPDERTICEMCEFKSIRYVHHMEHPEYPGNLGCGCVCAGHMEDDDGFASRRRESALKRDPHSRLPASYFTATLVRVHGTTLNDGQGVEFCAGMLMDPKTERIIFAAPLLRHLVGQHRTKLRQTFQRLGWQATIVQRKNRADA